MAEKIEELYDENEKLKKRIKELKNEISYLKSAIEKVKVERVITVERVVEPENYQRNMKRLRASEKENLKLRQALEYGNITSLETLIEEFEISSKIRLKKIALEFQIHRSGKFERKALSDFIIFLEDIVTELKNFLR